MHIVIMAGGSEKRICPIKSKNTPKQLLDIASERTMLRGTNKKKKEITSINCQKFWC